MYQQEFWWKLYRAAVLETDDGKLHERVQAAQEAIATRSSAESRVPTEERLALQESRSELQIRSRNAANFTTLQNEISDLACLKSSWTSFFDTVPRNVSLNTRPIV